MSSFLRNDLHTDMLNNSDDLSKIEHFNLYINPTENEIKNHVCNGGVRGQLNDKFYMWPGEVSHDNIKFYRKDIDVENGAKYLYDFNSGLNFDIDNAITLKELFIYIIKYYDNLVSMTGSENFSINIWDGNEYPITCTFEDILYNERIARINEGGPKMKYLIKKSGKEMIQWSYTPESLSKEILRLWNKVGGQLQDFYNAFTCNKCSNEMKKAIAEKLREAGYEIYPVLTDEKARYASLAQKYCDISEDKEFINKLLNLYNYDKDLHPLRKNMTIIEAEKVIKKYNKIMCHLNKVAADINDVDKLLAYYKKILPDSVALDLVIGECDNLLKIGYKVTKQDVSGLMDYYNQIYPKEYVVDMFSKSLTPKRNTGYEHFKDFQMSDTTLDAIEKRLSGNADPIYWNSSSYDNGFGYNRMTDMRSDLGVPPNMYETSIASKKKLIKKVADGIINIPYDQVLDVLREAIKNVTECLNKKLSAPPIRVNTIRKEFNIDATPEEQEAYNNLDVTSITTNFEIWKLFFEYNRDTLNECYIVIRGDYNLKGYNNGKWDNLAYLGFYTTAQEAENEILTYLN